MTMQAIITKYMGASNTRGARMKAVSGSGVSMTVAYDYALDAYDNHLAAANALMKKLGWDEHHELIGGGTKDGYVFVQVPKGSYKRNPIDAESGIHIDIASHNQNPAKRKGATNPKRASQITGKKPTTRLVKRRMKNTRPGYYPNPLETDMHGLRYMVSVRASEKDSWHMVAMFSRVDGEDGAKKYAAKIAKAHPDWSVKVEQE